MIYPVFCLLFFTSHNSPLLCAILKMKCNRSTLQAWVVSHQCFHSPGSLILTSLTQSSPSSSGLDILLFWLRIFTVVSNRHLNSLHKKLVHCSLPVSSNGRPFSQAFRQKLGCNLNTFEGLPPFLYPPLPPLHLSSQGSWLDSFNYLLRHLCRPSSAPRLHPSLYPLSPLHTCWSFFSLHNPAS